MLTHTCERECVCVCVCVCVREREIASESERHTRRDWLMAAEGLFAHAVSVRECVCVCD